MSAQAVKISIPPAIQLDRILYATDFSRASERALPVVSGVAHRYGAHVLLAHIYTPDPYPLEPAAPAIDQESKAQSEMQKLLYQPELEGLKTSVEIESGSPVERIHNYVKKDCIDLVVLGTRGRTGARHALMGSVSEELFRTLKCPVLTVGPNLDARFTVAKTIKSILFPTDLSPESKAVFPYLASLAAEFESEIVLLHVLATEPAKSPDAGKLAERLRQEMQHNFGPQLSPRCKARYVVEFGNVALRILSASDYYQSDLIGLGVREGNELITHLRTTVAYRVVVGAACPVLTVRGTL